MTFLGVTTREVLLVLMVEARSAADVVLCTGQPPRQRVFLVKNIKRAKARKPGSEPDPWTCPALCHVHHGRACPVRTNLGVADFQEYGCFCSS